MDKKISTNVQNVKNVKFKLDVGVGSNPKIVVNRISSLYGKERIETLLKHPALYVNTAKASRWVVDRGLQLPTVTNPSAGSNGRVQTPADLVKYKMESGLSCSLSGPSILDAAPTGRMAGEEKMQRLLNYARKEAARRGRTFSKETPNAKAAEAMGTVSSLLASIHKELPPMYRPRLQEMRAGGRFTRLRSRRISLARKV